MDHGAGRSSATARVAVWLLVVAASAALLVLLAHAATQLPVEPYTSFVLAYALVALEILVVARFAPVLAGRTLVLGLLLSFTFLSLLSGARLTVESAALASVGLLVACTALGAALGGRIERPGHLTAVAIVSGLADLWSVYDPTGPSARLAQELAAEPERLTVLALSWPLVGSAHIVPIIGVGDVMFSALYLSAFERHGLHLRRAFWGMFVAYGVGLALLVGWGRPVPLLPLLGVAAVLVDGRARVLARAEWRAVLVVSLVLGTLVGSRLLR